MRISQKWTTTILVLLAVFLAAAVLCSCGKENKPYPGKQNQTVTSVPETEGNGPEMLPVRLMDVLLGNGGFCDAYSQKMTTVAQYMAHLNSNYRHVDAYSVLDLDGDGVNELVLQISEYYGSLILCLDGDTVYGYELSYRSFCELKADGTFHWSGGAADNGTGRLSLSPQGCETEKITYVESNSDKTAVTYYVDGAAADQSAYEQAEEVQRAKQDALWHPYDPDNMTPGP